MKKLLALIAVLSLNSLNNFAQIRIKGFVTDSTNAPVSYVSVLLMNADNNSFVNHCLTDSTGNYYFDKVAQGNYYMQTKLIGYNDYTSEIIKLDQSNIDIAIPPIVIKSNAIEITGVVVNAKKPVFIRKNDRLIFNIENTITSQGGDAIDALKNTPLLKVDDKSISMVGKSNMKIMINGRLINLTGDQLIGYLNSIQSNNIAKIEVITTPSSKYDAEGNSGMVNIVLKQNSDLGFSGSLSGSVLQRTFTSYRDGANLNYQNKGLNITSSISYSKNKMEAFEGFYGKFDSGYINNAEQNKITLSKYLSGNIQASYKVNEKSELGLVYEANTSDFTSNDKSAMNYLSSNILMSELSNKGQSADGTIFHSIYGYNNYKLDSSGKSVELGFHYMSNAIDNNRKNETLENNQFNSSRTLSDNNYRLLVGSLDFELPFKKLKIKTGAKYSNINNLSNVDFYTIDNGIESINELKSNEFEYVENLIGVYSIFSKETSKWAFQTGLRYEYVIYSGNSKGVNSLPIRKYGQLFPTISLSYNHSETMSISLNYSKRTDRPCMSALNPFRWYINPYQLTEGNPWLQPSITHNLELAYSNNSSLNASLYFSRKLDNVTYLSLFTDNGKTMRYTYLNAMNQDQYGVNLNYMFRKIAWFQGQFSGVAYWQNCHSLYPEELESYKSFGSDINVKGTFTLGKHSIAEAGYQHSFPGYTESTKVKPYGFITLSFKSSFLEKQLSLGISASTIVSGKESINFDIIRNGATITGTNRYDYTSVRFSVNYKFGNKKIKADTRNKELEEAGRIK